MRGGWGEGGAGCGGGGRGRGKQNDRRGAVAPGSCGGRRVGVGGQGREPE